MKCIISEKIKSVRFLNSWRMIASKSFIFLILFLLSVSPAFSQDKASSVYNFNDRCAEAYRDIFNLKTNTARKLLQKERRLHPENVMPFYLLQYCSMVELIVTEDESKYDSFKINYNEYRDTMDRADRSSPWYGLLAAGMKFQLGLAYMKFGSKLSGGTKIYSAYGIIRDNNKKFPGFRMNTELLGVFNILFSQIPPSVKWVARLIGLKGDRDTGLEQVRNYYEYVKDMPGFGEEALLFLNFSYKYTWDEEKGLKLFTQAPDELMKSLLVKYFYASACSFTYRNDKAIELMDSIRESKTEIPFYGLDYLYGRCKLNRLDKDANIYLTEFLVDYPGNDYKKDICNRLSYYYLLNDDVAPLQGIQVYGKFGRHRPEGPRPGGHTGKSLDLCSGYFLTESPLPLRRGLL